MHVWYVVKEGSPQLCGFGRVDVWRADVRVVVGSWILRKVSELNTLEVGPMVAENQFRPNERQQSSLAIASSMELQPGNPRV